MANIAYFIIYDYIILTLLCKKMGFLHKHTLKMRNIHRKALSLRVIWSGGEPAGQRTESMKNSEKERKKLLTNRMIHDRMSKFATETERAPVPCKLNNAR